jgi:hypothetical protein
VGRRCGVSNPPEHGGFSEPATGSTDSVNHPAHYTAGAVEVIDILEQTAASAPDTVSAGLQWQVLKYLLRMWLKSNPLQDALKAQWYLNRLILRIRTTTTKETP